ncbi:MAG: polyprenyl synthetase family protein [Clostridia bacterium]|nr:polyprenyl synthetase family protein [Clostridia bacterium]
MNKAEYLKEYQNYLNIFERYAIDVFKGVNSRSPLADAMKYSFFAGGKRIRPVLMIATSDKLSGNIDEVLPFAFALECIHTYSLIHDDLPALDNDDLRRGKQSNHKKFGEAIAVLAGDGLLNLAFEHCLKFCDNKEKLSALLKIAEFSGFNGMLGGQALDVTSQGKDIRDEDTLQNIYEMKTCKFLILPFVIPAILLNLNDIEVFEDIGRKTGVLFQYVDDLSDIKGGKQASGKSMGKDLKEDKLTAVKIYGEIKLKEKIKRLSEEIIENLKSLKNSEFFKCFILDVISDYAN